MCGIVGYSGFRQATEVLLEGLRNLEYRGYDSAGISVFEDGCHPYRKIPGPHPGSWRKSLPSPR